MCAKKSSMQFCILLTLADKECEKTKNEEKTKLGKKRKMMVKVLFFFQAAANYASSYEIVCR